MKLCMTNNRRYHKVRKSFKKTNLTIRFTSFMLDNNSSFFSFRNFSPSSFQFRWHLYYSSCKVVKIFSFFLLSSNYEKK
jgi:hypothetical protein